MFISFAGCELCASPDLKNLSERLAEIWDDMGVSLTDGCLVTGSWGDGEMGQEECKLSLLIYI